MRKSEIFTNKPPSVLVALHEDLSAFHQASGALMFLFVKYIISCSFSIPLLQQYAGENVEKRFPDEKQGKNRCTKSRIGVISGAVRSDIP
jgi:hypothetical protein